MDGFNKNDKQRNFNYVRGIIVSIDVDTEFSSLTLEVGHENIRNVNLISKTEKFKEITEGYKIGDFVYCKFFVSSRKKNDRWYSNINLLTIEKTK